MNELDITKLLHPRSIIIPSFCEHNLLISLYLSIKVSAQLG